MAKYFPCEYEDVVKLRKYLDNKRTMVNIKEENDYLNGKHTYIKVFRNEEERNKYLEEYNDIFEINKDIIYHKVYIILGNKTFTIRFEGLVVEYPDDLTDLRILINDWIENNEKCD